MNKNAFITVHFIAKNIIRNSQKFHSCDLTFQRFISLNLQLLNYWRAASYIKLYLLGCFQRHNVLIHIIRSNWNFCELTQRSVQYRLRVYSNKNF